jgi:hypothetical protein
MEIYAKRLIFCMLAATLTGCATPKIDKNKFTQPKIVAISDFPDLRSIATIQIVTINWPEHYFTGGGFDQFFEVTRDPKKLDFSAKALTGMDAGAIGGIIEASANRTEQKAAEFPKLARKTFDGDLRELLLNKLSESLKQKGIEVKLLADSRGTPPRLRWSTKVDDLAVKGQFPDSEPINADVLVHICPLAIYAANGPLNNYTQKVGIAIAMFDARSRKFIGWQAFPYNPPGIKYEYVTYDGLLSDIGNAGPALQAALLSLVPAVANTISGQ